MGSLPSLFLGVGGAVGFSAWFRPARVPPKESPGLVGLKGTHEKTPFLGTLFKKMGRVQVGGEKGWTPTKNL